MGPVFMLSFRQITGRWRVFLLLFLAILPVALAALISAVLGEDETSNREFINTLLDGLLIAGILPLVMMVLATTAFGNELEDRTLSFLVLKPVPRYLIVLPKLLASVIVGGSILIASGVADHLRGHLYVGWPHHHPRLGLRPNLCVSLGGAR